MKRLLFLELIILLLLTACVLAPVDRRGHRSGGVAIAPLLPTVVVLGEEPYYFYSDFHYHFTNDRWYYSKSRRGPWAELPRDRYPKEVKHNGKHGNRGRDRDWDHDNRRY